MLRNVSQLIQLSGFYLWTARVPSSSNPADDPLRSYFEHLIAGGFETTGRLGHYFDVGLERINVIQPVSCRGLPFIAVHVQEGLQPMHSHPMLI